MDITKLTVRYGLIDLWEPSDTFVEKLMIFYYKNY